MKPLTSMSTTAVIMILTSSAYAFPNHCQDETTGTPIYVNQHANTSGDGSSWETAYTSLQDAISSAYLTPGKDTIYLASGNYLLTNELSDLPDNLTIQGGESVFPGRNLRSGERTTHIQINSDSDTSPFYTENNSALKLKNLKITGGKASGALNQDELNRSNQLRGGALFAVNSHVTICDSEFSYNQATKFGGAIYLEGGQLSVIDSRFSKNQVIRSETDVHDTLEEADTDGGAIAVHNASQVYISGTVFEENLAGDDGGAVAIRKSNVNVQNSLFKKNRSIGYLVPFTQPTITDDFVTSFGGGLAVHNEYDPTSTHDQIKTVTINNSRFLNNRSSIGGGVFVLGSPGNQTYVSNTVFKGNGGNGVPIDQPGTNLDGIEFGNGAAGMLLTGTRQGDREINADGDFVRPLHQAYISNTQFKNNESSYSGALVMISLNTHISDTLFQNNTARSRGGAIWNQNFFALFDQFAGLAPDLGSTEIHDSIFLNNKSLGILETSQAEVFVGVARNEEQTFGGGAISNDLAGQLKVFNSKFINNHSENGDGGAIHNANTPVSFFGFVGAPETYPANLEVHNSTFINNRTKNAGSGGAIANGGNDINGEVLAADGRDLASYVSGAKALITNSKFINNHSVNDGGTFANWNASELTVEGNTIIRSTADGRGNYLTSIGHPENTATIEMLDNKLIAVKEEKIYIEHTTER